MQKPTLRFRQVFEHPTHFKVVRPMGNPILIAKKALSPQLAGRLRRYAEGTGEVAEPTDAEREAAAELEAKGIGVERLPPQPEPPAPPRIVDETRVKQPFEMEIENKLFPKPKGEAVLDRNFTPQSKALALPYTDEEKSALIQEAKKSAPDLAGQVAYFKNKLMDRAAQVEMDEAKPPAAERDESLLDIEEPAPKPLPAQPAPAALAPIKAEPETPEEEQPAEKPETPSEARSRRIEELLGQVDAAEAKRIEKEEQLAHTAREHADAQLARFEGEQEKAWEDYQKAKADHGSYFSRLSTPKQAGTLVSLALGAFAAGWKGVPNFALKAYEDAVNEDLANQREDENSHYNRYIQAGARVKDAEGMVRAMHEKAFAAELQSAARDTLNLKAQIEGLKAAEKMDREASLALSTINKNAALVKEANVRAGELPKQTKIRSDEATRRKEEGEKAALLARDKYHADLDRQNEEKRHHLAEEKLSASQKDIARDNLNRQKLKDILDYDIAMGKADEEDAKRKADAEERLMNINGVAVPASQKILVRQGQDAVNGITSFINLAEEIDGIFKEHPISSHFWTTKEHSAVREKLAQLLERYPKAEQFKRPLNLTAATVIREGMGRPETFEAMVFDNPRTVMRALIEDARQNRAAAIYNYAAPNPGALSAAAKAVEKFGDASTDAALGARKAP